MILESSVDAGEFERNLTFPLLHDLQEEFKSLTSFKILKIVYVLYMSKTNEVLVIKVFFKSLTYPHFLPFSGGVNCLTSSGEVMKHPSF